MSERKADVVVIGAGPGGYVAAIRLGQLGKKAIVVERDKPGGVCLNIGCIPSKALITAAKAYEKIGALADLGITVAERKLDFARMMAWKEQVVTKLTGGVAQLVKGNGGEIMKGEAFLRRPGLVEVTTPEGVLQLEAKDVIVATGSRPIDIPGFAPDGKLVIESRHALSLAAVPKRLVVIGGGYIGLELGMMYRKLGTEVTVVEMLDQVLPGFDDDLAKAVARSLKKKGIETILGARAKAWEKSGDGARVTVVTKEGERQLDCDHVLVTVGRRPNSGGLGLEGCGVAIDQKGFVTVDEQRRTNVPGIWAIGDVAGQPMLAHKAYREAEVAAEAIAGHPAAFDVRAIPAVVFTDPEVAVVGLSEREAAQAGRKVKVGKVPFAAVSRAVTSHDTEGYIKVLVDELTKEIVGAAIIGPEASELIAEATLAIEMAGFADDVGLTIHAHPTLAEGLMDAARATLGEAIHILNR